MPGLARRRHLGARCTEGLAGCTRWVPWGRLEDQPCPTFPVTVAADHVTNAAKGRAAWSPPSAATHHATGIRTRTPRKPRAPSRPTAHPPHPRKTTPLHRSSPPQATSKIKNPCSSIVNPPPLPCLLISFPCPSSSILAPRHHRAPPITTAKARCPFSGADHPFPDGRACSADRGIRGGARRCRR